MSSTTPWLGRASHCALSIGLSIILQAQTQAPVQFKSDIQVRDLDGGTATGILYVGAAPRQRMEFSAFGETRPTITDPVNGTQQTISPRQRNYMEMPLGESGGPVRIPRLGSVDPANPCGAGQLSSCMRIGAEMLNGFATQKWQYVNQDGETVTAWIATRLRFPIKTEADNGATTELRNVVEGPQPAALFAVPTGFAQVDDIGGSGNAIADALAALNPAVMQQALATARQMEATNRADPTRGLRAAQWEAGPGYVMNLTVTMRASKPRDGNPNSWVQSTLSMRYTASTPLNYGTPAVPPNIGPSWSVQAAGSGSAQAEALPVTMSLEWDELIERHANQGCSSIGGDTSDTTTTVKGRAAGRASIAQPGALGAQATLQINGALTSYRFFGGVGSGPADVVTTARRVDHCAGDNVTNTTNNTKPPFANLEMSGADIGDVPLPPTPAGLSGSRSVPWRFNGYTGPATVEWNIAPIAPN